MLAYFIDSILCLPPQDPLRLIEILAVHLGEITIPALAYHLVDGFSRRRLERRDKLEDARAFPSSKIEVVDDTAGAR